MMSLKIKVIPNSKVNTMAKQPDGCFKIKLQARAIEGKANQALIKFLSEHFQVPKNKIAILSGEKSRHKTVKIED